MGVEQGAGAQHYGPTPPAKTSTSG
jgi:hypothetical protein